jgi:hypothetical protein
MKDLSAFSCAARPRSATALSRAAARAPAQQRRSRAVARVSLGAGLLAMSTTSCLITDVPQFQAPEHTAPFLLESCADPDPRTVVQVESSTLSELSFSACVVSQDDASGPFSIVSSKLYIDYGLDVGGQPFLYPLSGTSLPPGGTLEQTSQRFVSASWSPAIYTVGLGCHTATLIVSHDFDMLTNCPVCSDDFSTITWQVNRCDDSMGGCGNLPLTGCPAIATSCAMVEATSDGGTPCPENADGGAP